MDLWRRVDRIEIDAGDLNGNERGVIIADLFGVPVQ